MSLPDFDIRYTTLTDGPYLKEWLLSPGMLHWFPMEDEKEVEDAVQAWLGFCRWSCTLTATIRQEPCGVATLFLMPYRKVAHHCLCNLIVDPRRKEEEINPSLLKNLKHLAKNYFRLEILHMEVYEGNPVIKILEEAGFREFARQERYVKEGDKYLARVMYECYL